ncbi:flagellar hook capping FlgD N-terminal domain-containing protein [Paenibacillus sediminis]|uniref:Flagellar basal-body rod modification protein FlgD n=1 Tax=Paenibacillus sediminis TaxID=664909 RepID=A0ABS4H1L1_9BACL|nr:flagellar basal-body rod modification protein FlgD [Paenibacillus sediminis]
MASSDSIVSTSNIWPNYSAQNVQKASAKKTELGQDEFLKLLVTQMQYQDPLSPMDNTQYIAQLAQFSSLEQLTKISSQITALGQDLGNASGLIGKEVTWLTSGDAPVEKNGVVGSIIVSDGKLAAQVGSDLVPLDSIKKIGDTSSSAAGTGTNGAATP